MTADGSKVACEESKCAVAGVAASVVVVVVTVVVVIGNGGVGDGDTDVLKKGDDGEKEVQHTLPLRCPSELR
jgi:hypothetical protein